MNPRPLGVMLGAIVVATAACDGPKRDTAPSTSAAPKHVEAPSAKPTSSATPVAPTAASSAATTANATSAAASAAPSPTIPGVAGDVCKAARGPVQLPFTGQVALWIDESAPEPRFVQNHDGVPRAATIPAPTPKKKDAKKPSAAPSAQAPTPERLALSEPAQRATTPGCAAAGGFLFCMDRTGAIHKSAVVGQQGPVVARARAGAPIAASSIGGSHVLLAYLADKQTTEGTTTVAHAIVDDAAPVLLSEEGAGATFITLAPRGAEVVAMYVDARRVLTPVHARVLTFADKLALGSDAVLFVGGGSDGRLGGALALGPRGTEHALIAIEKDFKDFGMAAIRIEDQPRDDARVTWSLYPAGMERAAVAATQGTSPIRVLRTRPASADPRAKAILELGELDAAGVYKATCAVAESAAFRDLAIAVDRRGSLWLAYTDADGTWVEERGK
jgi:hypothetical protein